MMKQYKHLNTIILLSIFIILMVMVSPIDADEQNSVDSKKGGPANLSTSDYNDRLDYEKTILKGLMKLLSLKELEILPDKVTALEIVATNENLSINKEKSKFGATLYTIKANLVLMDEILYTLASASDRKLIIDEDVGKLETSSIISVFLEHTPLVDIVDIILGAKGLESIISDSIIFITLPAKLNVVSSYEYYQGKAVQAFQRAMIKFPNYKGIARAYYELGNFYFTSGFPTIALQEYSLIVQKFPKHSLAKTSLFSIGKCYEKLDNLEMAIQTYLSYTNKYSQESNVVDVHLVIGDLWRKQHEYEKAIATYKKIVKEYPKENTAKLALMRLGFTYIDAKDYDLALSTFLDMKKIFLLDKFKHEIEYNIGNCYYLMGKYTTAENVLGHFVLYENENDFMDNAYYKLADCYFKSRDYLKAYQLYNIALEKFPESNMMPYGLLYSGKSLRMMNMVERARSTLREGIERYSNSLYSENMKFELGLCYFDDELFNHAFDVFDKIDTKKAKKDTSVRQSKIYAGICLSFEKKYRKAIEYYIKALVESDRTIQERHWIFKLMGDSYTELGDLAQATKAYQGEIL